MKSTHGRHGGHAGETDKHEVEQAKSRGMAESLSGARNQDETEGHTSGKD